MGDLGKIFLSAFAGGVVTFVLGPVISDFIERRSFGQDWEGTWLAISCRENGTDTGWKIEFSQDKSSVIGRYQHRPDNGDPGTYKGGLSGTVEQSRLSGRWDQHIVGDAASGDFVFVIDKGKSAFSGTYTDKSEPGITRIWNGRRDGKEPTCDQFSNFVNDTASISSS